LELAERVPGLGEDGLEGGLLFDERCRHPPSVRDGNRADKRGGGGTPRSTVAGALPPEGAAGRPRSRAGPRAEGPAGRCRALSPGGKRSATVAAGDRPGGWARKRRPDLWGAGDFGREALPRPSARGDRARR